MKNRSWGLVAALSLLACGAETKQAAKAQHPAHAARDDLITADEIHFADLRQVTFGGENAEAYWAFDGSALVFQAHATEGEGASAACDQIYHLPLSSATSEPRMISTGKGATTCAYFMPGNQQVIYASTHLGGEACPPKPDHSQGYVWALYPSYDIFKVNTDGSGLTRLTQSEGYDAEATVCAQDGSILFTSVRDGDIELYRMDKEGGNVQRLTHTPGYDGGAFFNHDCSKILWRASRPEGEALRDFRRLLAQHLVRPSKLELYVANADGSEATQITYLNAASFAPYWHPSGRRVLFSSNYGDPKGREFDLWAVNIDGTGLERITHTPGFDGFPMFSPDGKTLAFASNRANAAGSRDTNVFLTRWLEASPKVFETAADRLANDVRWLADPAREGRGLGTQGLQAAGAFIEERFKTLGLEPLGDAGSYRQTFEVPTRAKVGEGTRVQIAGKTLDTEAFRPLVFSAQGEAKGQLALAGYGIVDEALGIDDYKGVDVKGKIAVVRRFVPDTPQLSEPSVQRRLGDLRYKAWVARARGARALLIVDAPVPPADAKADWQAPSEASFPGLVRDAYGDAGLPVLIAKRASFEPILADLAKRKAITAQLNVNLVFEKQPAFNVLGRLPANVTADQKLPGQVVIGAHYDHLGMGGLHSLAPDVSAPHVGADDNASGVAAVLEIARTLREVAERRRDVVFIGFSAEEGGVLGSSHLVHQPPAGLDVQKIAAMLNLDMVGRLRENRLTVLGGKTATEWDALLQPLCGEARVSCSLSGDGYGPSDQTSFYAAGIPVLHFFTGPHSDYHKPSDTADRVNAVGMQKVAEIVTRLSAELSKRAAPLSYQKIAGDTRAGDARSFNASLGTIPDYAGPKGGSGVLLSGVRPGSAAEKAGMKRGDVIQRIGTAEVKSVHDLMFVLNAAKPGQTVSIVVQRDGKPVTLQATFEESKRRKD